MRASKHMRSCAGLAIGLAVCFLPAHAQRPLGPPQSSGSGSLGPGDSRVPAAGNGSGGGALNGNVYLTGNVMLDDGGLPPERVTIERVCGGAPRAQAYTDQKGRFSFQIGQTAGVMQDASEESSGMPGITRATAGISGAIAPPQQSPGGAMADLALCDLRAVLAGFRSDTVSLGARRTLDDPNVGTIVLHRLANVEGSAISMTSLEAPKEAQRAYARAVRDLRKKKLAEAGNEFHKAVTIYPKYAAAWYEMGRLQAQTGDATEARYSFENAIAADAKFIPPYLDLSALQAMVANWTGLAATTAALLKLDAVEYPIAYFYNASANLYLGQIDTAEKSARAGQKLDTPHQYPRLEEVLAMILKQKQDYADAAAHLASYLRLAPDADDAGKMKKELAELQRLTEASEQAKAAAAKK